MQYIFSDVIFRLLSVRWNVAIGRFAVKTIYEFGKRERALAKYDDRHTSVVCSSVRRTRVELIA